MGLFDRIQAQFNPPSRPIPEEPLRGVVISSPAPPTPSQRQSMRDYVFPDLDAVDEEGGMDADGLPTYSDLFPNGPYQFFWDLPRPAENPARPSRDPRRLKGEAPLLIPISVIDLLCDRVLDASYMAILARLNHSTYNIVIPHLYHQIRIDRYSLPKILYGIPLPISGFTFDPKAKFDGKGKQKQVFREDDVIPHSVEERKRKCLEHVKEIRLEEPLLDWRICQSLLILRDPEYGRDYSDTQPLGRYHPMREPEEPGSSATMARETRSTILMPNVETVYVTSGAVIALEQWEKTAKSPHILLDAIHALCGPKMKIISETSPTSDDNSVSETDVREITDQFKETFGPESSTWRPFVWK
jgi:hypothetical protein